MIDTIMYPIYYLVVDLESMAIQQVPELVETSYHSNTTSCLSIWQRLPKLVRLLNDILPFDARMPLTAYPRPEPPESMFPRPRMNSPLPLSFTSSKCMSNLPVTRCYSTGISPSKQRVRLQRHGGLPASRHHRQPADEVRDGDRVADVKCSLRCTNLEVSSVERFAGSDPRPRES